MAQQCARKSRRFAPGCDAATSLALLALAFILSGCGGSDAEPAVAPLIYRDKVYAQYGSGSLPFVVGSEKISRVSNLTRFANDTNSFGDCNMEPAPNPDGHIGLECEVKPADGSATVAYRFLLDPTTDSVIDHVDKAPIAFQLSHGGPRPPIPEPLLPYYGIGTFINASFQSVTGTYIHFPAASAPVAYFHFVAESASAYYLTSARYGGLYAVAKGGTVPVYLVLEMVTSPCRTCLYPAPYAIRSYSNPAL